MGLSELHLRLDLKDYEIKEYPETGTMLIVRKGVKGLPDYSIEGEGITIEFKDGKIYAIDIYDPEVAQKFKKEFAVTI